MNEESKKKIPGRAVASQQIINLGNNSIKPGYVSETQTKFNYHKTIEDCRYFYHVDPLAGTVVNRLCEIAVTNIRNRRKNRNAANAVSDEIMAYYNAVAAQVKPFITQIALEYVLHGMVIPEFTTIRKMGNRATDKLGRTRYHFPDKMWCRNVDNIELVKLPSGADRLIFLKIPSDEITMIKTKGGKDPAKIAIYEYYLEKYPEYVAAVQRGETKFQLRDTLPLYRKLTSYNTYPLPYLINAIDPMKHKGRLKAMDMSIAARVIEAVRQIKVGNDEYPADDDDLRAEQQSFIAYGNTGEKVFNYFTNHTVDIVWSYPPFESLLSETKYTEPNREILFALGFPRIWINGETEKSNAADNNLASQGPLATIEDIRGALLLWVTRLYEYLAELNNFDRIPEPYFTKIIMADVANLIQYANDFYTSGAISLETVAEFYGKDWENENEQRIWERDHIPEEDQLLGTPNATNQETQEPESTDAPAEEGAGIGARVSDQNQENT